MALNDQQRTQIATTISGIGVQPLTNPSFSVAVGTAVPASVQLSPLPPNVVNIVPQYRGFSYFVVERQIAIVDPNTKQIVTLIPMTGTTQAAAPAAPAAAPAAPRSKSSSLTTEQREVIRKHARSLPRTKSKSVTVGERLPDTVEVQEFPETIYREVPEVRRYRYFVPESGGVSIVDPGAHTVVETIE